MASGDGRDVAGRRHNAEDRPDYIFLSIALGAAAMIMNQVWVWTKAGNGVITSRPSYVLGFGSCLHHDFRPWSVLYGVNAARFDAFLQMGDFIYSWSDSSKGLDELSSLSDDEYRALLDRLYADALKDPGMRSLMGQKSKTDMMFMWDDHEIFDNYDKGNASRRLLIAKEAYRRHVAAKFNPDSGFEDELYFTFSNPEKNFSVFMLDTRSHRSEADLADTEDSGKTMLGSLQLERVLEWLSSTPNNQWKILASSVMWNDFAKAALENGKEYLDGWAKYTTERKAILSHIQKNEIRNIIFLSADAHWSGIFQITDSIVEFSVSPLAAPPLKPPADQSGDSKVIRLVGGVSGVFGALSFKADGEEVTFRLYRYSEGEEEDEWGSSGGQGKQTLATLRVLANHTLRRALP